MSRDEIVTSALTILLGAMETMRANVCTLPAPARHILDEQLRLARVAVQALQAGHEKTDNYHGH